MLCVVVHPAIAGALPPATVSASGALCARDAGPRSAQGMDSSRVQGQNAARPGTAALLCFLLLTITITITIDA